MSRDAGRHGPICWAAIVGSWAALAAADHQIVAEATRTGSSFAVARRSVTLPAWIMTFTCAGAVLLLVASVSRRGRAWMRMRPRLSRSSSRGSTYLEAFALKSVLAAVLAAAMLFIYWSDVSFALTALLILGKLGPIVYLIPVAYVFVRSRSFRIPLAECGWQCGRGLLHEVPIGVVAGVFTWSMVALHRGVMEPNTASLGFVSSSVLRGLSVAMWVPIVEETLYRGMLYRYLRDHLRWSPAVVFNALVFALMHPPPRWTLAFLGVWSTHSCGSGAGRSSRRLQRMRRSI